MLKKRLFMNKIQEKFKKFSLGLISKDRYIVSNYDEFHSVLFEYADYISKTNISKVEIEDDSVVVTFRDSGIKISCPPGDHRVAPIEAFNFLDYEKEESWMISHLVDDGDTIFDIGANMGYYSVQLASKYRKANVHCFEPIPITFRVCEKNIARNNVTNIISNNFGLSDKDGSFPFYFYPEGSGNASEVNVSGRASVIEINCILKTLDGYTAQSNLRVDFIKCDVEGAELFTFKGGMHTLKRDKPIVFAEILRKYCLKFNYNHNDIFDFFYGLGYRGFTVQGRSLKAFYLMDENTIQTNFFFLHAKKHEKIILDLMTN